jgi:hypothetical protein
MTARGRKRSRQKVLLCLAAAALVGCGPRGAPPVQTSAPTAGSEVRIAHLPPRPKDVLEALLRSSEVSLSVDRSCNSVGTEATDQTIGRYVSGFLAEQSEPRGKNWIETGIEPDKSATGDAIWRCRITIRHEDGDDRWGWGVQFDVRQSDGVVIKDSYRCLGAG